MEKISHDGIVESACGNMLRVRILQATACSTCKVSRHCHASDSKVKIIDVIRENAEQSFNVGDKVIVSMPESNGREAVFWAFVLPLIIVVGVIFIIVKTVSNEGIAALSGIGVLLVYYLTLYFFRDRLFKKFVFSVDID